MSEDETALDPRDFDRRRPYEVRTAVPSWVKNELDGFIVKSEEEEIDGKRAIVTSLREGPLNSEEKNKLYTTEKKVLKAIISEHINPAVYKLGVQNENIYPYDYRYTVEMAENEVGQIVRNINEDYLRGRTTEASKEVLGNLERMKEWLDGNAALLKASGSILQGYFDGWAMMANALRTNPRHEITPLELDELYAPAKKEGGSEWVLGKELQKKQDQTYEVMRTIAAAHRYKNRNSGKIIENDYPITDRQAQFIQRVFADDPVYKDEEGVEGGVFSISEVLSGDKRTINSKIFRRFSEQSGRPLAAVVGKRHEITSDNIKKMKKELRDIRKTLWVDGVRWGKTTNSYGRGVDGLTGEGIDVIAQNIAYKAGSGDEMFIGEIFKDLKPTNYTEVLKDIKGDEEVAILELTPSKLRNLFVMHQSPNEVEKTKRMIGALTSSEYKEGEFSKSVWERLSDKNNTESIDKLIDDYKQNLKNYEFDEIDKYIVDTTRIALLFYLEGAELGWGFEYAPEKIKGNRRFQSTEVDVVRRNVESGSSKSRTDISRPFHWLRTEAENEWKAWPHSLLPMDNNVRRQFVEHEPGWAPWKYNNLDVWTTSFLGEPIECDAPTKFDLSFLESASDSMNLIKQGSKMSEILWTEMRNDVENRWLINLNQVATMSSLLSTLPDRETSQLFFGENLTTSSGSTEMMDLLKKQWIGFRDMGKEKTIKKFLPLVSALYISYRFNLLPESNDPGYYRPSQLDNVIKRRSNTIKELAMEGNQQMANEMAGKFEKYMEKLTYLGEKYSVKHRRSR